MQYASLAKGMDAPAWYLGSEMPLVSTLLLIIIILIIFIIIIIILKKSVHRDSNLSL